jgi:hypothetical protein
MDSPLAEELWDRRLPGLEALPRAFVMPHYGGYSIANVAATVAALLGVELANSAPPLPADLWADLADGVRCVVLLVLDGLGYLQFQRVLEGVPFFGRLMERGRLIPLTSTFPSTTVTALTTLHSGRTPLEHGFVGTRLFLSAAGTLANMLRLSPLVSPLYEELLDWGWQPEQFVTVPSLESQLAAAGVECVAHTHHIYLNSGLSDILMRDAGEKNGFFGLGDLAIGLRHTLLARQHQRLFVSAYWSAIDTLGHAYGPTAEPCQAELRLLGQSLMEDLLDKLPAAARQGTVLVLVADHGQVPTPPAEAVDLSAHPLLNRMLFLPPAGESRAAYLYARPGQKEALRDYLLEHLSDRFTSLETDRALEAGLFGPPTADLELRGRLGDWLLLAHGNSRLVGEEEKNLKMYGHHGSLLAEEMVVPFLMVRLDD